MLKPKNLKRKDRGSTIIDEAPLELQPIIRELTVLIESIKYDLDELFIKKEKGLG